MLNIFFFKKRPLKDKLVLKSTALIFCLLISACPFPPKSPGIPPADLPSFPAATFIVLSDLHVYDTTLGVTGRAFQEYLDTDRKLLQESAEILQTAVTRIIDEQPDFVIVAGDLTKDGEPTSHDLAAAGLAALRNKKIPVFVIPGNHDIANPEAARYHGDHRSSIPSISASEFAGRYADFGYSAAFARDTTSLSYAAEPIPGLWLIGLDANQYLNNQPNRPHLVAGRLPEKTIVWLTGVLEQARQRHRPVIVFMHHGLIEHFPGQQQQFPEYLVADHKRLQSLLIKYGVRIIFTGHFHAQDIAGICRPERHFLYDIETGSLVTYPLPYRRIEIGSNQNMLILSRRIQTIPSRPSGLLEYARQCTRQGLIKTGERQLIKYLIPETNRQVLTPMIADLILSHYAGDENTAALAIDLERFGCLTGLIFGSRYALLQGLSRDPEPPDNDLIINLKTGQWLFPR